MERSTKKKAKGRVGSSFDSFLAEEGILEECEERAVKELLAMQVASAMKVEGISKAEMARRMKTSRPAPDRLLDAANASVRLHTLQRAATAVGKSLRLDLLSMK